MGEPHGPDPGDRRLYPLASDNLPSVRMRRRLNGDPLPGTQTLGIEAAAEMEGYFAQRSADIAAHFGIPERFVARMRAQNPPYWDHMERTWMEATFGPLAPLHQATRQERDDRRHLRAMRRAARREAWAKGAGQWSLAAPGADSQGASVSLSSPRVPLWQRLTVGLMDGLRRLTGAGLVLAALYYLPVWLAHHDLLPVLTGVPR